MARIACLSLQAFVWRFAREFHDLTLTALWLLHYGPVVLRHPSPLLHGFRKCQGRNFTAVSRTTYTGSGRSIRVSGRAGDDAIGGG